MSSESIWYHYTHCVFAWNNTIKLESVWEERIAYPPHAPSNNKLDWQHNLMMHWFLGSKQARGDFRRLLSQCKIELRRIDAGLGAEDHARSIHLLDLLTKFRLEPRVFTDSCGVGLSVKAPRTHSELSHHE